MAGRESKEINTVSAATAGREKALETTLANLKKRFGEGTIMKLGDATGMKIESIPTGSIALDLALGVGGLPRGRVIEIYGPESSGKTTICLHVIAEAQRTGGMAAFVDVEHALDPAWAAKCGVKVEDLYVSQPDTGEQALEIAEALIRSGAVDVVVVDSVAALVPRAEIEGEMGDSHVGLQARLMSQALRKLAGAISTSNTVMIFTNQLRQKIGVMFGNPETTTGGQALRFYASVRLDVRKTETIKQGDEAIGNRTRVTIKKNKVAPPFKTAEFDIMGAQGISKEGGLIDVGVELGVIDKRGAFFSFNEQRLGQGRENVKNFLMEHPELAQAIEARIREEAGLNGDKPHVVSPQPVNGNAKLTVKPLAPALSAPLIPATPAATAEDGLDDDDEEFDGFEGIGSVKQGRLVE